ncbi:DUF3060 domain-containing protein [Mycobacterium decipiens]|uniref:DUF3060 domain-containing protein n=1 Tax=Mycobacterium decipiens TaxID=1430326 RepID=A0A1X2LQN2_9MYCO|nr:DUF3060 domain-containing protein [Mycobacterium decipiens]OSC38732.1 hypothetical protein B8W66_19205 [Mycobacterium decipiens]
MNPEDDPETRIRELERPLDDVARASELGSPQPSGYAYPPGPPPQAPPPYNYGDPFLGRSSRSSSGTRMWWILAALFVVGVLALVGGIAAFSANRLSRGNFVVLSPSPSVSRATQTPTAQPATPLPPAGASLSVSGVNVHRTIACNDNIVSISGVSNTVVITGHCASLTVSGMRNSVTVDSVDSIEAAGFNNEVTYRSGSPKISKAGDSNVVQQG